jgi:hypothetical protein
MPSKNRHRTTWICRGFSLSSLSSAIAMVNASSTGNFLVSGKFTGTRF